MLLTAMLLQASISGEIKAMKVNYLSMNCDVKMFLAKTKGLQK